MLRRTGAGVGREEQKKRKDHRIVETCLVWEKWHAIDDVVSPETVVPPSRNEEGRGGSEQITKEEREGVVTGN